MAGATPEAAVDAFVERMRATLACVSQSAAFASGNSVDGLHSFTLYQVGQTEPNIARLRTHGGMGALLLRVALLFRVEAVPHDSERRLYEVRTAFYQYKILDQMGAEVVVYDYSPAATSRVRTPHLHVPIAGSVILAQPPGSPLAAMKTHVGKTHFPTGHIFVEDIVDLLIRDFHVDPLRADWARIVEENRRAFSRDGAR